MAPRTTMSALSSFAHLNQVAKAKAQPGESRSWGGKRYTKQADGSWKPAGGGPGGGRQAEASGERRGKAGQRLHTQAPESIDYSEEDPKRQQRARRQAGRDKAEAQHLDAAEEARHGL